MSKLLISCYAKLGRDADGKSVLAPEVPALAEWALDVGDENQVSDLLPEGTKFAKLKSLGADCSVAFGSDPVAVPGLHVLEAGEWEFVCVPPNTRIAVINSGELL